MQEIVSHLVIKVQSGCKFEPWLLNKLATSIPEYVKSITWTAEFYIMFFKLHTWLQRLTSAWQGTYSFRELCLLSAINSSVSLLCAICCQSIHLSSCSCWLQAMSRSSHYVIQNRGRSATLMFECLAFIAGYVCILRSPIQGIGNII